MHSSTTPTGSQYCTFTVADYYFGVDVLRVQEVIRFHSMTPVPMAPEVVQGLINLRGQIVTAIDMRVRLDLAKREPGEYPMNVIISDDDGAVSLLVDAIDDVLQVDQHLFEHVPETVDATARELVSGVYKLDGRLLLILDTDKAVRANA